MRSRLVSVLALVAVMTSAVITSVMTSGVALAQPPDAPPRAPTAPVALFVDGVKVGAIATLSSSTLPKSQPPRVASRCSSCTIVLTY